MSRIFLFSANLTVDPYPVYPLGMAVIAGALAGQGHQVRQFDYLAAGRCDEALARELAAFAPDYVCFSLRNIDNVDSFSCESNWYLAQAREQVGLIRAATAAPVIVGGPAFSIMPEAILAYLGADYGVIGEGEAKVCELVAGLEAGRAMAPLVGGSAPLLAGDEMGSPLLVPELVDFYQGRSGMINLQTKRGCPYRCSYCTYPSLEGSRFRFREPRAVADDLERAVRDHGIGKVFFTDSIFNDPGGRFLGLAEELIRRRLPLQWCAFFRPQGLGRDDWRLLKRAGLYAAELGTDAASDATLAGLEKGLTFAEVRAVSDACLAEEIPCAHFVIFGGPGETAETVEEGLANLETLGRAVVFGFSGIRILSGTSLQRQAVAEGIIAADAELLRPVFYFSPRLDAEAMNARIEQAFRGRRDRIFPPSAGQEALGVMHRFGFRGILWDQLISFQERGGRARRRAP